MAWRSIQVGDLDSAAFLLRDTVHLYPDSADAWYLLSLTTGDRDEKLEYLERALSAQPYHEYAWRDKGILEGVLPAQAPPDPIPDPAPDEPVEAKSVTKACPLCNGALAFDAGVGTLVCGHCGYRPGVTPGPGSPPAATYRGGYDNLDNALLQRRFGFSREWKIGARVLICQNCRAQLTLGSTTFSTQCPFCDSAHILVQDAVGSFEEPDALLPFKIDRTAAAKALHKRMPSGFRTQVERGEMWGVYLPFWSFEGAASVLIQWEALSIGGAMPGAYPAGDVLVGGVTRPIQAILYELMPYDLDALIAYDPRYLARWSAQIYNIDVIQASLTARAYIKYAARRQAAGRRVPPVELARSDTHAYTPPNTPIWRSSKVEIVAINYRLLLLPVWMITLILRDGTRRPAVVNGQTGEAILSASFDQPEMIVAGPNRPPVEPLPIVTPTPPPIPRSAVIRPLEPRRNEIRPLEPRSPVIRPLKPRK
jgi:tetratricopeptide (TPR) repeat protein